MTKRKSSPAKDGVKIMGYLDENGDEQFSALPEGAPPEDAALGIPVQGTSIALPDYMEPFRPVLERAYAERGIFSQEDIQNDPQIEEKLRKAHQQAIRFTLIDVVRANREEDNS